MRQIFGFTLLSIVFSSWCQLTPKEVLLQIDSMQLRHHSFYDPGLFPSQRTWNLSKDNFEDNTIFFTASIVQTLSELRPLMDLESRVLADSMMSRAKLNYIKYRSREGEPTFNFWQTIEPDLPFPNGSKLISNSKMRLPDDLDTSVILAMSSGDDKLKAKLRAKMTAYATRENRSESELATLDKYESSEAYEVWFAKKMPQTFDICVISNALLFVFAEGDQLNKVDLASIQLLKRMIKADDHFNQVDDISHHTTSTAVILYHVARLLDADHQGLLKDIEPKVVSDLIKELKVCDTEMEKMLILSSLSRLRGTSYGNVNYSKINNEMDDFAFFSVKPLLGRPELDFLDGLIPTISWTCEAYNRTLYLEYLHLSRIYTTNISGSR